jgi:hypothetical protein
MLTPKNQMGSYKEPKVIQKEKNISDFNEMKKAVTSMPKRIPTNPMPKKVTTTMGVDKSKGLMPGKPTAAPMPVSKAKQIASNIASKLKRG